MPILQETQYLQKLPCGRMKTSRDPRGLSFDLRHILRAFLADRYRQGSLPSRSAILVGFHMLLESSAFTARWTELLSGASHIDIAVAWITNDHRIDDLLAFAATAGHDVRVVAGVGDYVTSPGCLRRLHAAGLVKIGVGEHGCTFHPKLYLFTLPDGNVCWVGSANLMMSGFGGNTELIHEYNDDGTAASWFARTWNSSAFRVDDDVRIIFYMACHLADRRDHERQAVSAASLGPFSTGPDGIAIHEQCWREHLRACRKVNCGGRFADPSFV